jgi:hypothetical protein
VTVKPSYSVACAVLCAGLVLLGFVTTSALGGCGGGGPQPADMADDVETGRPAPKKAASAKRTASPPVAVAPSAPAATATAAAGGSEVKDSQ